VAAVPHARTVAPELLDGAQLDPNDLRVNLREMAMLNRLPGGVADSVRLTLELIDTVADPTVLDVGTGSGDYVRRLVRARPVRVVASDVRPEILTIAERHLRGLADVSLREADARSLPFEDASFDVVHASLVMHHLEPPDAVTALREMRRVARRGVVVNDLRRGTVALALTALSVLALSRGRYTRHDGVLSARRAYTLPELDDLATAAGLAVVRRTWRGWPRVTTVLA
jgi:SAM-dependent methyltransferase